MDKNISWSVNINSEHDESVSKIILEHGSYNYRDSTSKFIEENRVNFVSPHSH